MDLDLKGYKRNCHNKLMGDLIIHNGRRMSEVDTRMLVNYAIEQGYELISEVPDELADRILDPANTEEFKKYDDTPDFWTQKDIESAVRRAISKNHWDWDAEGFINELREEL